MRVIVAGSREGVQQEQVDDAVTKSGFTITEIVSGHARGVDQMGELIAEVNHLPIKLFPADWKQYGKAAGIIRNHEMALYADALIAVWDGKSKGTQHMILDMQKTGKPVYIYKIGEPTEN